MARRHYLVEGGQLECTLGTAPGEMVVTSQQKLTIKHKLKATSEDKAFKPPFFGSCKCSSPNPPCLPVLKEWKHTSKKSRMGDKTFVMKNSQIQCSKGGMITVKDVGQTLVGTGKEELELDKKYAKLQGEIIFANGYLSSSLGGTLNAMLDLNPDEPNPKLRRGWNVNETDKIDEKDIQIASEVAQQKEAALNNKDEKDSNITLPFLKPTFKDIDVPFPGTISPIIPPLPTLSVKVPVPNGAEFIKVDNAMFRDIPELNPTQLKNTFWGYWNLYANDLKATDDYANHFNAGNNQHFLNGSHGLESNAAHRIDHGIAQGYHWAKFQWGIIHKEEVDDTKEKIPYIKSYSPAYKPLTIVMHSQGNAPGVGFALGAMKYANELGWEQIPLNLIFLGVHQPQNLWEEEYKKFINAKVKHYVADTNFWDTISAFEKTLFLVGNKYLKGGVILKQYLSNKEDKNILKYLNGTAELFSPEHHKLRHKRGIYEHLQAITSFEALQKNSVQFTFSNDRADIVCRDGDIPKIDSACNPKIDKTLYSVEFLPKGQEVPADYTASQGKEVVAMENGGNLVIPAYAVIQRVIKEEGEEKEYWKDYRSIAIDWGNAMSTYRKRKKEYQQLAKQKLSFLDLILPGRYVARKSATAINQLRLDYWFRKIIFHYARIQIADLYAHFSPVGLINNDKVLNSKNFRDTLGNENIWARIKKTGEQKFYRMEYVDGKTDLNKLTDEEKEQRRKDAEKYIEKDTSTKNLLIDTSIADTDYINNVIKAFVEGDESAERQLYEEPLRSDKEQATWDEFIKKLGDTMPDALKKATEPYLPSDKEIEQMQEYIKKL